jgi:hypothetical protein
MSGAQERSSGLQSGAQASERPAGNVPGGNTAAGNTPGDNVPGGNIPGGNVPGGNVPGGSGAAGSVTGATSASVPDQSVSRGETTSSYARGTAITPSYGTTASEGTSTQGGSLGGVLSMLAGLLAFLTGLSAVVRQSFYPAEAGYAYRWTIHGWGWVLLILGALLFAVGACALLGMVWARAVGVGLAVLTSVAGFLFLAYTPIWGTILVALSVIAIWGLLRTNSEEDIGGADSMGYESTTMDTGSTTTSSRSRM